MASNSACAQRSTSVIVAVVPLTLLESGDIADIETGEIFDDDHEVETAEAVHETEPEPTPEPERVEETAEITEGQIDYSPTVLDMASKLEENPRPTFGSVASAAMAAQVGYNDDHHALNALSDAPLIQEHGVEVAAGKRVKKDTANKLYWYLIDRKLAK
jgi:hypothetical protein